MGLPQSDEPLSNQQHRIAIVFFNLGGPLQPDDVKPFLFNLFNDPAIIRLPRLIRYWLARFISHRRQTTARQNYAHLGGKSPLLANTIAQMQALETAFQHDGISKTFIAMRYWHPLTRETITDILEFQPTRIILLPLYPQFSSTTTASSLKEWRRLAEKNHLHAPTTAICCYPCEKGFIAAFARQIAAALDRLNTNAKPRLLFSAHGLPESISRDGDPYHWQVEQTATAIIKALNRPDLETLVCFQSRIGPARWIGPSTEDAIHQASLEGRTILICPLSFVSEHSETLVELDIEYHQRAMRSGAAGFIRIPTPGVDPDFIASLIRLIHHALSQKPGIVSGEGGRICPLKKYRCALESRQE